MRGCAYIRVNGLGVAGPPMRLVRPSNGNCMAGPLRYPCMASAVLRTVAQYCPPPYCVILFCAAICALAAVLCGAAASVGCLGTLCGTVWTVRISADFCADSTLGRSEKGSYARRVL
jgi:hypothetical protein